MLRYTTPRNRLTDAPRGTRTRSPPLKRRVLLPFELPARLRSGTDETRTRVVWIDNPVPNPLGHRSF
jgi:hypothetical protein